MNQDIIRHRGGQPGNQNARKHGYYSSVLSGQDKANLTQASRITGLDNEIALLRARLKAVVQHNPDDVRLISEATSTLCRLIRTKYKLGFDQADQLEQAIRNVYNDIAAPLGLGPASIAAMYPGKLGNLDRPYPSK